MSVCALHDLFCQTIIVNPLHCRFFGLDQTIFNESIHDAANRGVFAHALRNVRFRSESLIIIGHAFIAHAELGIGFIDDRENGRHAPHDALCPNHRRVHQICGITNVHNFHRGNGNAAEQFNAVAAAALQEPAGFIQKRIQALAQHAVGCIIVWNAVLKCLTKMRFDVHVGFRVKFTHHFANEAVMMMFHIGRHSPTFADLAVQTHDFGFGQHGNSVPVFGNAGCIHAIHLLSLALRVVFNERRALRAVQHFKQAVQRHCEPHNRSHDEMQRLNPAFGVLQLGGVLPAIIHLIQNIHRLIMRDECCVNERARFIQQFLPSFGQLLARHNALFMQIWIIQFYYLGICGRITRALIGN